MNSTPLSDSFHPRSCLILSVWMRLVLLPLLPMTAFSSQESDFVFFINGGGAVISQYVGKGGAVVIPDRLGNKPVIRIDYPGFSGVSGLTSVVIPNSVNSIGVSVFSSCTSLTTIAIPEGVTYIGLGAFSGCTGLTNATIPASVTFIGEASFSGCPSLTLIDVHPLNSTYSSVDGVLFDKARSALLKFPEGISGEYSIPGGVISIGNGAFGNCGGLTIVSIPDGLTTIGSWAFFGCARLNSVTIPDSVTNIGESAFANCGLTNASIDAAYIPFAAFSGCPDLKSVTIGNRVASILGLAFSGCTRLTTIAIPERVTDIAASAFLDCTNLVAIEVDSRNSTYRSVDGILADKATSALLFCPRGKTGSYVIPNGVTSISNYQGYGVFAACSRLTDVTIPNSVTDIGREAFRGCNGLSKLTIPDTVISIGEGAFRDCTSLPSVRLPNSLASIMPGTFADCTRITNVYLADAITSIEDGNRFELDLMRYDPGAFEGCTSLADITLPSSLTYLGRSALARCTSLTRVAIPNSVTFIGIGAFAGCRSLISITLPEGISVLNAATFSGCTSLTSVTFRSSVTEIFGFAFEDCSSLTSVFFEGDAPELIDLRLFPGAPFATVFYRSGTTGWMPTFALQPTAVWVPRLEYADWVVSTGLAAQFPTATGEADDPDGDGLTNSNEWFAGTDPTQRASRLELELAPRPAELTDSDRTPIPADQHAVYVRSVPGRYYGVQRAAAPDSAWELQAVRVADTMQTRFLLPKPVGQAFYRVLVLP